MDTTNLRAETPSATLELIEDIVYVRIKPDSFMDLDEMKGQIRARQSLTGDKPFAVLVDARPTNNMTTEARKYLAKYSDPNWAAMAVLNDLNLATRIMINVFMRYDKPSVSTKLFKREEDALTWLNERLDQLKASRAPKPHLEDAK